MGGGIAPQRVQKSAYYNRFLLKEQWLLLEEPEEAKKLPHEIACRRTGLLEHVEHLF